MKTEKATRASRVAWILGVLGLALLGIGGWLRLSARATPVDPSPLVHQARDRVERALASQARELEPRAAEAARVPELIAALSMGADRTTIQDLLETEDWWRPFRKHFPLSGVVTSAGPLGLIAPGAADVDLAVGLRGMTDRLLFSTVLPGHGRAFLTALAKVSTPKQDAAGPVVLLGTLVDHAVFAHVSESTGDAVGLADGSALLESAGPGEPGRVLAAVAERQEAAPLALGDGRLGIAWSLGHGLRLLAAFSVPAPPASLPAGLPIGLLVVGAIVLLAGFALGLTGPSRAPSTSSASLPALPLRRSNPETSARGHASTSRETVAGMAALAPSPETDEGAPPGNGHAHPNRMGRYDLIERIGEGGMAEIFFAAAHGAEDFVRHFVVKRMHREMAQSRVAVNQFIDEAKLQARLVHSNIVPVFDFGKAGDEYFLALEYIHGKDLHQVVHRHLEQLGQPLDLPTAFYIMHEVMVALAFAHSQTEKDGTPMEVVHRDVAPGNVLVSYEGEVKLSDFGIAKAEKRVSRTEVGMVKGNASFMSPEQARGGVVDQRSDIFSAGLVLYHCLTAQPFYRGETPMGNLLGAAVGPATAHFDSIDRLPAPAAQIIRRAVDVDPDQRYPNATAFQLDLEPHMGTRGDLARTMDGLFPVDQRRDLR